MWTNPTPLWSILLSFFVCNFQGSKLPVYMTKYNKNHWILKTILYKKLLSLSHTKYAHIPGSWCTRISTRKKFRFLINQNLVFGRVLCLARSCPSIWWKILIYNQFGPYIYSQIRWIFSWPGSVQSIFTFIRWPKLSRGCEWWPYGCYHQHVQYFCCPENNWRFSILCVPTAISCYPPCILKEFHKSVA